MLWGPNLFLKVRSLCGVGQHRETFSVSLGHTTGQVISSYWLSYFTRNDVHFHQIYKVSYALTSLITFTLLTKTERHLSPALNRVGF